ncbi:MAG: hypothetical protein Q8K32_10255 [Archangium sp.]|nr:hypothetical protein [Archangium sp.]
MMTLAIKHVGELKLRRFLAHEPLDAATTEHLGSCAECATRLSKFREEQRAFEAEVPFDRFAPGVERAARQQKAPKARSLVGVFVAIAACLVAFFAGKQVFQDDGGHRIKGGAKVDFVVAGPGGQRPAAELEQLATGERVRIGVSGHRHVLALSIDDAGEVSMVYSETLQGEAQTWLPESIEFTGAGREHVVVLLSDAPLETEALSVKLQGAWKAAGGDLNKLGVLEVNGVQVHRTFLKP